MMITGISDNNYVADLQISPKTANATAATGAPSTDSISLSSDYIQSVDNGLLETTDPSNYLSMFSVLNANILDYPNLAGVGSAIDTYTNSLSSSNVYDSSYTAPSAKYLADLANLKSAAAAGNMVESKSLLATAKLDAPESVAGGLSTAISKGDATGEANLMMEGTANMSGYLANHGYSSAGAMAEAVALAINGLSENADNASSSSVQMRLQQISDLAVYVAHNQENNQSGIPAPPSDPLFNIISTLLNANSGTAIEQSLANLDHQYEGSTPIMNNNA